MRIRFLIVSLFVSAIFLFLFYIFILPPQVVDVNFLDSSIVIKFSKPVDRRAIEHEITPAVYGEWQFKDSLIENHLFSTLVFIPAAGFDAGADYQLRLGNITSPFQVNYFSGAFVADFKIQGEKAAKKSESEITILDIPLDWQDKSLSCEAASLKMALHSKGVIVSEDEIMEKIGYDPTPHAAGIWGDPYQAYVGEIDGKMCGTGYGVYWEPVAKAANSWRQARVISGGNLEDLTREIELGNPVVVWGALPVDSLTDCSWSTPAGKYIKAFKETHVRLVVGFMGEAKNPSKIIINDPLSGVLYWPADFFLTNWKTFGYSGVVIK